LSRLTCRVTALLWPCSLPIPCTTHLLRKKRPLTHSGLGTRDQWLSNLTPESFDILSVAFRNSIFSFSDWLTNLTDSHSLQALTRSTTTVSSRHSFYFHLAPLLHGLMTGSNQAKFAWYAPKQLLMTESTSGPDDPGCMFQTNIAIDLL
jgi:hypothetical protein